MKLLYSLLLVFGLSLFVTPAGAMVHAPKPPAHEVINDATADQKLSKKEERKLRREQRREFRKALRDQLRAARRGGGDVEFILLVIIGLLIPPLAMFLYEGAATSRFWISLALLGGGLLLWGTLGALSTLASVVYTLYVIISESF